MPETKTCPKCGAELPGNAPYGICPKCLMLAGLDSRDESHEPVSRSEFAATTAQPGSFVPPVPESLASHFAQLEILELLGHGGMGAVYKARQTKLDRLVALKIIRPESADDPAFAERFNREARMLARLNHPNIVAVHEFGEVTLSEAGGEDVTPRTLYYFLMEYVDGANLRRLIQSGELRPEQALVIIPQICEALQFAHDEGIIHRDIKPENILLDRKGRVKIADFGLAKLAARSPEDFTLTGTHQVMGTLRYMAPEQMEGSHGVDHRADIYSLGVVFYEILTGEIPAGHFEPPSRKVDIDARLDEVVLRALAKEPERRYQHASEVKTDVESISQSGAGLQTAGDRTRERSRTGVAPVGSPATSITHEQRQVGNPASLAGNAESASSHDWMMLARVFVLLFAVGAGSSAFLPWSQIRVIVQRDDLVGKKPIGYTLTHEARGYDHYIPAIASVAGWALFACMIFTMGMRSMAWRAILTLSTAILLASASLFVASGRPLTNHPDWFIGVMNEIVNSEAPWWSDTAPMEKLLTLEQGFALAGYYMAPYVDIQVEPLSGCWGTLALGVVLLALGALELQATSIWPRREARPRDADDAVTFGANGLLITAALAPVMLAVLFVATILCLAADDFDEAMDRINKGNWDRCSGLQIALMVATGLHVVQTVVLAPLIFVGGLRMRARTSRWLAATANVLAALPLNFSFVVGLPVAILGLVTLHRPQVVGAFREQVVDPELAQRQLRRAGIGLFVVGTLGLVFCAVMLVGNVLTLTVDPSAWPNDPDATWAIPIIALFAFGLPTALSVVQMIAARKLWRLDSVRWAITAAVISMIPFTPLWLVGLPLGVWTLAVLGQRLAGGKRASSRFGDLASVVKS